MKGTWQTTSGGGGGLVLVAVIVGAAVLGSGAASAIASAAITLLIVLGSVIGLAVVTGVGALIWRARSDRPRAPIPARAVSQLPPQHGLSWRKPTSLQSSRAARPICTFTSAPPSSPPSCGITPGRNDPAVY